MNSFISRTIRHRVLYHFWIFLKRLSLYGLNYGVSSGLPNYSGENYIIRKLIKKLDAPVIIDVGANIGDWTSSILKILKNNINKVHLIEPSHKSYEFLLKKFNNNKNVLIYNIGFNDMPKELVISYNYESEGSSGVFHNGKFKEKINTTTLDLFCEENNIEEVDFIKMDVQGLEFNILKGAEVLIKSDKIKIIQFEVDSPTIYNRVFFKDFWDLLSEKYKIYHSLYNGLKEIKRYDTTLEIFSTMNYVAIHKKTNSVL